MGRKIILVGALVLMGENATTQVFFGVIICVFYLFLSGLWKPLVSGTDQFLQYVTSIQLFITLITGLLLRNAAFEKDTRLGGQYDDTFIDVFLVVATIMVLVCIIIVLYIVGGDLVVIFWRKICCWTLKRCKHMFCTSSQNYKKRKKDGEEYLDESGEDPDFTKIKRQSTQAIVSARKKKKKKIKFKKIKRLDTGEAQKIQDAIKTAEEKKGKMTSVIPKAIKENLKANMKNQGSNVVSYHAHFSSRGIWDLCAYRKKEFLRNKFEMYNMFTGTSTDYNITPKTRDRTYFEIKDSRIVIKNGYLMSYSLQKKGTKIRFEKQFFNSDLMKKDYDYVQDNRDEADR